VVADLVAGTSFRVSSKANFEKKNKEGVWWASLHIGGISLTQQSLTR